MHSGMTRVTIYMSTGPLTYLFRFAKIEDSRGRFDTQSANAAPAGRHPSRRASNWVPPQSRPPVVPLVLAAFDPKLPLEFHHITPSLSASSCVFVVQELAAAMIALLGSKGAKCCESALRFADG